MYSQLVRCGLSPFHKEPLAAAPEECHCAGLQVPEYTQLPECIERMKDKMGGENGQNVAASESTILLSKSKSQKDSNPTVLH